VNYDGDINHLYRHVKALWVYAVAVTIVAVLSMGAHAYRAHPERPTQTLEKATDNLRYGDMVVHKLHDWKGMVLGVDGQFVTVRFASGGVSSVHSRMHAIEWEK